MTDHHSANKKVSDLRKILDRMAIDAVAAASLYDCIIDRIEALGGFVEEVRDCSPEVHSGRATDPQDDTIDHSYLIDLQYDAEKLIGKKPKTEYFDAARRLTMFGRVAAAAEAQK